jgi:hypothetical protein
MSSADVRRLQQGRGTPSGRARTEARAGVAGAHLRQAGAPAAWGWLTRLTDARGRRSHALDALGVASFGGA